MKATDPCPAEFRLHGPFAIKYSLFLLPQKRQERGLSQQRPDAAFQRRPFIFKIGVRVKIVIDKTADRRAVEFAQGQLEKWPRHEPVKLPKVDIGAQRSQVNTLCMQPFLEALDLHGKLALRDLIGRREISKNPQPVAYTTPAYVLLPARTGIAVLVEIMCRKAGAVRWRKTLSINYVDGLPGLQVMGGAARERMVLWVHGFCRKMHPGTGGLPVFFPAGRLFFSRQTV